MYISGVEFSGALTKTMRHIEVSEFEFGVSGFGLSM